MSDHIPFEIQEEIMKKLPVKPLIQFRSVSKQWKSVIDSSKFIKNYHVNQPNPQHHLLVQYQSDVDEVKYISIIDDNTFPNHKFSVTYPQTLDFSDHFISGYEKYIAGSSHGIICIRCYDGDNEDMAVLWNPAVRISLAVVIPHLSSSDLVSSANLISSGSLLFGFGVCPETNDPKLLRLNVYNGRTIESEAKVFTLSTKVWKTVTFPSTLYNNCHDSLFSGHVCTQGFIYFLASKIGVGCKFIVSFDLRSEEFGQVYLPDSLLHSSGFALLSKRNECLTLLETYNVDDVNVWMMNDSVAKSFTKVFTLSGLGRLGCRAVLGFRKNGKAIIRKPNYVVDEDTEVCLAEVYDQRVYGSSCVSSYMETLLLFDEADSAIY